MNLAAEVAQTHATQAASALLSRPDPRHPDQDQPLPGIVLVHGASHQIGALSKEMKIKASDLQDGAVNPANIIVAHPFNPVYLLPLSEVSGSEKNPPEVVEKTVQIMKDIGGVEVPNAKYKGAYPPPTELPTFFSTGPGGLKVTRDLLEDVLPKECPYV